MKYIYAILASAMLWFIVAAQFPVGSTASEGTNLSVKQMDSKHAERMQAREARNADYMKYMDSVVLSKNYRFLPTSFQLEPAGSMQYIYNTMYGITMYNDYFDIDLPYYKGIVPPYYITMLNAITYDMQGYLAVQESDGWSISFGSSLYGSNDYKFNLRIYSVTRFCVLTISSNMYNTVTYNGSIQGTY